MFWHCRRRNGFVCALLHGQPDNSTLEVMITALSLCLSLSPVIRQNAGDNCYLRETRLRGLRSDSTRTAHIHTHALCWPANTRTPRAVEMLTILQAFAEHTPQCDPLTPLFATVIRQVSGRRDNRQQWHEWQQRLPSLTRFRAYRTACTYLQIAGSLDSRRTESPLRRSALSRRDY